MPLELAALALLLEEPRHCYALAQGLEARFDGVRSVWFSSTQKIYRLVDGLSKRGLIEGFVDDGSTERQQLTRYRVTPLGRKLHHRELVDEMRPPSREELLVRLLSVHEDDPEMMRGIIDAYERARLDEAGRGRGVQHAVPAPSLAGRLLREMRRIEFDASLRLIQFARDQMQADATQS